MSAITVYNAYRAKILENLKPKETVLKWKNTTLDKNEVLSPTFEDHILLSVLQLIDSRLPAKVREIYGPRIENERFLMDFKQDILANTSKMLNDLDTSEVQVNALHQQFNRSRNQNRRQGKSYSENRKQYNSKEFNPQLKFCRLCHTSRRSRHVVTSHEIGDLSCPSLSDSDKTALRNKSITTAAVVPQNRNDDDELAMLARLHGYEDEPELGEWQNPTTTQDQVQTDKASFTPLN